MRVAVIGSGIAGMVVAHLLSQEHDIIVFEANDYIGGHRNTVPVEMEEERYNMVTLNHVKEIESSQILKRVRYSNPTHKVESVAVQKRHQEISGINRTHFCGAYWGYGFHEDGAERFVGDAQLVLTKPLCRCNSIFNIPQ